MTFSFSDQDKNEKQGKKVDSFDVQTALIGMQGIWGLGIDLVTRPNN